MTSIDSSVGKNSSIGFAALTRKKQELTEYLQKLTNQSTGNKKDKTATTTDYETINSDISKYTKQLEEMKKAMSSPIQTANAQYSD